MHPCSFRLCGVRRKAVSVPSDFMSSCVSSIAWLLVSEAETLCVFGDIFERRKKHPFQNEWLFLKAASGFN